MVKRLATLCLALLACCAVAQPVVQTTPFSRTLLRAATAAAARTAIGVLATNNWPVTNVQLVYPQETNPTNTGGSYSNGWYQGTFAGVGSGNGGGFTNLNPNSITGAVANAVNASTASFASNSVYNPPLSFYGVASIVPYAANPILPFSAHKPTGRFQDQDSFNFRGQHCILYTEATNATANPYGVNIGLMTSPDNINWTDWRTVITTNATGGKWDSGCVFSPSVLVDGDTLWIFVTGNTNGAEWYPPCAHQIGLYCVTNGASFTNAASYVKVNNGNPILTNQVILGTDGPYSPSVRVLANGVTTMFFSMKSNATYYLAAATNVYSHPTNNDWRIAGTCLAGYAYDPAEEPCIFVFSNCLVDISAADANILNSLAAWPVYMTTDLTGLSGWSDLPPIFGKSLFATNQANLTLGSLGAYQNPDGSMELSFSYGFSPNDTSRSIAIAKLVFNSQYQMLQQQRGLSWYQTALIGTPPVNAYQGNMGVGFTNSMWIQGGIFQNSNPGYHYYSNYLYGINIRDDGNNAAWLTFGDNTVTTPYMWIARDNGPNSAAFGNYLSFGTSVEMDWRFGSGAYSTQTNAMKLTSTGFTVASPITFQGKTSGISASNLINLPPWYRAGIITFGGSPSWTNVTFATPLASTNYCVVWGAVQGTAVGSQSISTGYYLTTGFTFTNWGGVFPNPCTLSWQAFLTQ